MTFPGENSIWSKHRDEAHAERESKRIDFQGPLCRCGHSRACHDTRTTFGDGDDFPCAECECCAFLEGEEESDA